MRTISLNLYEFDELNEQAQESAIKALRSEAVSEYCAVTNSEFGDTLEAMEEVMGIKVETHRGLRDFTFKMQGRWAGMEDDPKFLCRYLNYLDDQTREKRFYSKLQPRYARRESNILHNGWCLTTGDYQDTAFIKSMERKEEDIKTRNTIYYFVQGMLIWFFTDWEEELEYAYNEDEVVTDHIDRNGFLFLEDGTRWGR